MNHPPTVDVKIHLYGDAPWGLQEACGYFVVASPRDPTSDAAQNGLVLTLGDRPALDALRATLDQAAAEDDARLRVA